MLTLWSDYLDGLTSRKSCASVHRSHRRARERSGTPPRRSPASTVGVVVRDFSYVVHRERRRPCAEGYLRAGEVTPVRHNLQLCLTHRGLRRQCHPTELSVIVSDVSYLVFNDQVMLRVHGGLNVAADYAGASSACCHGPTVGIPCRPFAGSRQNFASDPLRVSAAGKRVEDGRFNGTGLSRRILTFPAGRLQTSECATGLQRLPVTADCPSRGLPAATMRRSDPVAFHARPKLPRQDLGCRRSRSAARPYDAEIRTYYDRARS